MAKAFAYESSDIDWCEDNYKYSEHVVEYFNTVSLQKPENMEQNIFKPSSTSSTCISFSYLKRLCFPFLDEQLFFLYYLTCYALPATSLRQREELGNSPCLDSDDFCR